MPNACSAQYESRALRHIRCGNRRCDGAVLLGGIRIFGTENRQEHHRDQHHHIAGPRGRLCDTRDGRKIAGNTRWHLCHAERGDARHSGHQRHRCRVAYPRCVHEPKCPHDTRWHARSICRLHRGQRPSRAADLAVRRSAAKNRFPGGGDQKALRRGGRGRPPLGRNRVPDSPPADSRRIPPGSPCRKRCRTAGGSGHHRRAGAECRRGEARRPARQAAGRLHRADCHGVPPCAVRPRVGGGGRTR